MQNILISTESTVRTLSVVTNPFTYRGAWNWLCVAIACWSFSSLARLQWQSYKTRHRKSKVWKECFI